MIKYATNPIWLTYRIDIQAAAMLKAAIKRDCPLTDCPFSRICVRSINAAVHCRGVVGSMERLYLAVNERLYSHGRTCRYVYVVTAGTVSLTEELPDGRQQIIDLRVPGQSVGEEGLFHAQYIWAADAASPVELCRIDLGALDASIRISFAALYELLRSASADLIRTRHRIAELSGKSAEERVAALLVDAIRGSEGSKYFSRYPLSNRRVIASFLGIRTETLSRILSLLARENIIGLGTNGIPLSVIDPRRLRERAGL